jgi:hypothetical protein
MPNPEYQRPDRQQELKELENSVFSTILRKFEGVLFDYASLKYGLSNLPLLEDSNGMRILNQQNKNSNIEIKLSYYSFVGGNSERLVSNPTKYFRFERKIARNEVDVQYRLSTIIENHTSENAESIELANRVIKMQPNGRIVHDSKGIGTEDFDALLIASTIALGQKLTEYQEEIRPEGLVESFEISDFQKNIDSFIQNITGNGFETSAIPIYWCDSINNLSFRDENNYFIKVIHQSVEFGARAKVSIQNDKREEIGGAYLWGVSGQVTSSAEPFGHYYLSEISEALDTSLRVFKEGNSSLT